MPSRPIDLVCFDLGGVLVRIVGSFAEACERAGLAPAPEPSAAGALAMRQANEAYMAGRIDFATIGARWSAALAGHYSPAQIQTVLMHWLLGDYAGGAALVGEVHQAGLRTACLSNTCEEHWDHLRRYPAVAALGQTFLSHRLGNIKPEPEIYAAVERQTGVPPGRIAVGSPGTELEFAL